ncbi:39S ribosomal protein L21, mitochondrial-like [Panonychus citri]|uniref:39S ribosomal protein L21, mitochondrial-like n=1 Tax=Panonychus citri TaxID=50023 RepID=UPI00230755AC|nr:39S ribosomal protein L21, mitochondrial-like [Panonychus citri]
MFTLRRVLPGVSLLRNGSITMKKIIESDFLKSSQCKLSIMSQNIGEKVNFNGQNLAKSKGDGLEFSKITEADNLKLYFNKVNQTIDSTSKDRHFAVVYMYSKQKLLTEGDMFYVLKDLPANPGDRIKLEKIMMIGNDKLTLVGRPLLDRNLVHVEATVIEKTHSHTFMGLVAKKRSHRFRRYYFQRKPLTILRINEIRICHHINESHSFLQ